MMASMCLAQTQPQQGPPSGVVPSSRTDFGSVCGIRDTAAQRAVRLTRSSSSKWSVVAADKRPASSDNMAARVWHESNWMVDLHDAPGRSVPVIHTGQMCFDGQGRLTRMIDRYVELAQCRCMRFTSLAFAADGTVTQREEKFVDEMTGAEIGQPAAAKAFPGVWQFRRLEQLPFYSLLNPAKPTTGFHPSTPTAGALGTPGFHPSTPTAGALETPGFHPSTPTAGALETPGLPGAPKKK